MVDVAGAIDLFRTKAADEGRIPEDIPISIFTMGNRPDRIASYAALGVDRVVIMPPTMDLHSEDVTMSHIDAMTDVMADLNQ